MKTIRLPADGGGVAAAAEIIKRGGCVAVPTETVYGLASSAYDEKAVARVFEAKGRPQDNPLIVHIAEKEDLSLAARDVPEIAYILADAFWPGPFTMVLPRCEKIPASVSAGLSTVAVRLPRSEITRKIIKLAGVPLAAPSANLSGSPSPTEAAHVLADMDGLIDAVVMAGSCSVGVESTVVSLCCDPPRLLRPGGVTPEELKKFLPDLAIDPAVTQRLLANAPVSSPGMKYKHYSPRVKIVLCEGDGFSDFVNSKEDCGALCFCEELSKIEKPAAAYGSKNDQNSLAAGLFSALRECDRLGVPVVYAHAPEKSGVGLAVYNRLIRAAAFEVIKL